MKWPFGKKSIAHVEPPERFEDTDPEAAEELEKVCNDDEYRDKNREGLTEIVPVRRLREKPSMAAQRDFIEKAARRVRRTVPTQGRNERCACGSGKKYKRCCGGV